MTDTVTLAPTFTPPRALSEMIAAALTHKRHFKVEHGEDSGGSPFVTFRAVWMPDGCDIRTDIRLTWHTRDTGTYRLFSATAAGYYRAAHDTTAKKALALLSGDRCFYRDIGDPDPV